MFLEYFEDFDAQDIKYGKEIAKQCSNVRNFLEEVTQKYPNLTSYIIIDDLDQETPIKEEEVVKAIEKTIKFIFDDKFVTHLFFGKLSVSIEYVISQAENEDRCIFSLIVIYFI